MTRAVALALVLLAGCTAEPAREASPTPAPPVTTTVSVSPSPSVSCPPAPRAVARPSGVPRDLPWPPGARVDRVDRSRENVLSIRGTGHGTLDSAARWLRREMPAAGFELGRGDASPTEVNLPFERGSIHGLYRFFRATRACEVVFVLALVRS